jgi:DNA-binding beta-propeller fold protein YncE
MHRRWLGFILLVVFAPSSLSVAAPFKELGRFHLVGDGGWDCLTVDAPARRLYLARSNKISVVNVESGSLIGEVTGLDGAHAIAIVKERNQGFATSGNTNDVVAFDLNTLEVKGRVHVGAKPDIILYESLLKKLFVFNAKDQNVTVVDPIKLKVDGSLALPGKPEFAVSNGKGLIAVNIEDKSELVTFDAVQLHIVNTYPIAGCEEPTGLAMDLQTQRWIIGCGNQQTIIMDASNGKVLQTFKVGTGVDGVAFDKERNLAFVSAGEGLLTILSEDNGHFSALQNLTTVKGARTLALDSQTGQVFLPFSQFSEAVAATNGARRRPSIKPGTFEVLRVGQ